MTAIPALRTLFPLLPALLVGCGSGSGDLGSASRGAVEATVDRYVAASNDGDAEALTALYADDAVLLPPDHEPIHGREAIGEFWREGTDTDLEVSTLRLEVDGNVAYLVGRYRLPPTEAEEADSGQYVLCLKRQPDGIWKLTADIWNGSGGSDERGGGPSEPEPAITGASHSARSVGHPARPRRARRASSRSAPSSGSRQGAADFFSSGGALMRYRDSSMRPQPAL